MALSQTHALEAFFVFYRLGTASYLEIAASHYGASDHQWHCLQFAEFVGVEFLIVGIFSQCVKMTSYSQCLQGALPCEAGLIPFLYHP